MPETAVSTQKVGRPRIERTEALIAKLEMILMYGLSIKTACQHARISEDLYYDWQVEDQEFSERMQAARNIAKIRAGQNVSKAIIEDKDPRISLQYLKLKEPGEFNDKNIQLNINTNVAVQNNTAVIEPQNPQQVADWNDKFKQFLKQESQK